MQEENEKNEMKEILNIFNDYSKEQISILKLNAIEQQDQINLQLYKKQEFLKNETTLVFSEIYSLNKNTEQIKKIMTTNNQINLPTLESSFQNKNEKIFKYIEKQQNDKKTHQIQIWEQNKCQFIIDTSDYFEFLHTDYIFGSVIWNKKGNKIIFVGEKKVKKDLKISECLNNFDEKYFDYLNNNSKEKSFQQPIDNRFQTEIFILDLEEQSLNKLDQFKDFDYSILEVVLGENDELYFVGMNNKNVIQSMIYCFDRKKTLFYLKDYSVTKLNLNEEEKKQQKNLNEKEKNELKNKFQKNNPIQILENDFFTCFGLKMDKNYDSLYILGSEEVFYEHNTNYELWKLDIKNLEQKEHIINKKLLIEKKNQCDDYYSGLYFYYKGYQIQPIIKQIFSNEKNLIVLSNINKGRCFITIYCQNEKKLIQDPFDDKISSYEILSCENNLLFIMKSMGYQKELYIYDYLNNKKFLLETYHEKNMNINTKNFIDIYNSSEQKVIELQNNAQGFLILPKQKTEQKIPLLVEVHGGPFSCFQKNQYSILKNFFLRENYALLSINFRGSTGYGKDFLQELLGNGGIKDVEDCINIINKTFDENQILDRDRLGIMGYSHGGFLTGHLITHPEFSKKVKCSFIGNGVLGPQILFNSHIPSWTFATLQTTQREIQWPISQENLSKLYESTPLKNVNNVQGEVLIWIGEKDRTVGPDNGKYFYNCLKSLNKKCHYLTYANDWHQMTRETQFQYVFQLLRFFKKYI